MPQFAVRAATTADLPRVLILVTGMFHDLGTNVASPGWEAAARDRLAAGNNIAAFVTVDATDRPIATAVGVIDHRIPSPRRPTGRIGYLEWLATDPPHRRQGAARLALTALLTWFDDQGVPTIDVHASSPARPLYESLGFRTPTAIPLRRATTTTSARPESEAETAL
ncbi:GNAT family N-acetyltransferase [Cryptosporangium sp. NPDC051539]|uniref:GNAT family N-acetyltransferase n=1 Tax=Cryptosporangium sp. NPDC051539 TaxID=3363962 RepID=UPI003795DC25